MHAGSASCEVRRLGAVQGAAAQHLFEDLAHNVRLTADAQC